MSPLLKEIRKNPLLWLLAFVPVVLVASKLVPGSHTLLFVMSVLLIIAYLIKHTSAGCVCQAIREVHKGNTFFSPAISKRLQKRDRKKI